MSELELYKGMINKMKDDEILNYLTKFINDKEEITKYGCEISVKQAKQLLDYITNLQQENERLKELDENYPIEEELAEAYRREEDYKSRIEKAVEYIENNTRWFDSEYASFYGELCNCTGANDNRLEVVINSCNLLNILNGKE